MYEGLGIVFKVSKGGGKEFVCLAMTLEIALQIERYCNEKADAGESYKATAVKQFSSLSQFIPTYMAALRMQAMLKLDLGVLSDKEREALFSPTLELPEMEETK